MRNLTGLSIALSLLMLPAAQRPASAQMPAPPRDPNRSLAVSGQVSGTVLTAQREPVRGASIAVFSDEIGEMYGSNTGPYGRYAVKGLRSSNYSVLVMDPDGNVLRKDNVSVRPLFRNLVDFVTEPAGSPRAHIHPDNPLAPGGSGTSQNVAGSMTETNGDPITEAWVTLTPLEQTQSALRARTDVEGKFRLVKVPAGYYKLHAKGLGHIAWNLGPILLSGEHDLSIHLTMLPFPLGQTETLDNLLVPVEPATPETFEKKLSPPGGGTP